MANEINELVKATTNMNPPKMKMSSKMKLGWMKHGSTIAFWAGLTGAIGAGVLGAFGALKAKAVIDQQDEKREQIKNQIGKPIVINGEEMTYTEEIANQDLKVVKKDTIVGVTKAIAPAVGLGAASVGALGWSKMNDNAKIANTVAYASVLEQQVERSRNLLAEKVGQEEANMLMAGYHKEKREVEVVNEETGEVTTTVEEVLIRDLDIPADGVFCFTFKRGWLDWKQNREMNLATFSLRFRELQSKLDITGVATLDYLMDVFDVPAEERHGWDHVVGWIGEPGRVLEYTVLPPTGPDDYDITFILETDGVILKKIDDARVAYEKRIGLRSAN